MSDSERGEFLASLEEQKSNTFNNKAELLAYCMDDVNVLRQACCSFLNLFLNWLTLTPFDNQ
jgi:hypothetical protein